MKTLKTKEMNVIQRRRRLLAAFVAAALLFCVATGRNGRSFGASEAKAVAFTDVRAGDWFEPFVTELAATGIISGYPDGTFRPSNQVTVGQFLSMAIQTGQRNGAIEPVKGERKAHWAQPFYEAARENDLIFRDELPKTALDQPIPRLWMAVLSSRMMAKGTVESGTAVNIDTALDQILDVEELQPYSYEIATSYARGLLSGYPDGTFRPEGYLTRAEAATVIYKLDRILAGSAGGDEAAPAVKPDASAEPTDSAEPVLPTYGFEQDPDEMSAGTKLFWFRIDEVGSGQVDSNQTQNLTAVHNLMKEHVPELAEELYRSFEGFAHRATTEQARGKQGLRKEYVGGYPVLMEAVGGEVRVYVKPKGSETRFWGVEPGQVSEEFF